MAVSLYVAMFLAPRVGDSDRFTKEGSRMIGTAILFELIAATALVTVGLMGQEGMLPMSHSASLGCCIAGSAYLAFPALILGLMHIHISCDNG